MNIYETLKQEHDDIQQIFEDIAGTRPRAAKTKQRKFEKLHKELLSHEKAEEQVFYPKITEEKYHEDVLEAIEEHHASQLFLDELEGMPSSDERWNAKLTVLQEMIEHHIEEEEETIFKDAADVLSEDQAEEINREFLSTQKDLKSSM